ncbi:MAG: glycosyltransferase [Firmicutes bacterium]|nr:glycosyltransferase [Bacillota bacterium]
MILSIGMIMKNEEKYLRDCLTFLQPILKNVDSELIICDTGSTDNSIKIAKEFTENVLEIEWRDDFGWARQQGFQLCKGEWFFVLDPDEIFPDVQEIIDFFNSGEYKNFGCAAVKINNTLDKNNRAAISEHVRLFKIVENMQWRDKIHEQLLPFVGPIKYLQTTCLHYGYLPSEKKLKNKQKRNLTLILETYKENPDDYRNILHMVNEYSGKLETQRKYAEIGNAAVKKIELENYAGVPHYYPAFVQKLTQIYNELGEYEEIINCVNEYFEKVPQISANAHYLKFQQSFAFLQTDRLEEARQAAFEAFALKKQADNNELHKQVLINIMLPAIENEEFIIQILETSVRLDDFAAIITWLQQTLLQDKTLDKYKCYARFVGLMFEFNPPMLAELYWHFVNFVNQQQAEIVAIIESGIKNQAAKIELAQNILKQAVKIELVQNILKQQNVINTPYIQLQKLRLALNNDDSAACEYLNYFIEQDKISQIYADVLVAAIKYNKFFEELSQKINIVSYMNIFDYAVNIFDITLQIIETNETLLTFEMLDNFLQQNNFMKDFTEVKPVRLICDILNRFFDKVDSLDNEQNQLLLFEMSTIISHKFYKMIYSSKIYCESGINALTNGEKTTFYLGTAYEHKNAGNIADFAKYMRLAIKIAPQYKNFIQKATGSLQNEIKPPTAQEQLQQETADLKQLIQSLLNSGFVAPVKELLEVYAQINPADTDFLRSLNFEENYKKEQ